MASGRAYLDWNATTPLHAAAKAAVVEGLEAFGNPSSIHAEGRAARALMEKARTEVAALVGGEAENVVFTSGATEAINALLAAGLCATCGLDRETPCRVLVGATEHAAVLAAAGSAATILPVDGEGWIDMEALRAALARGGPALVAIQIANNETGLIQPIREIAAIVREAGGFMMVDAVQAPGKIPLDIKSLGADALVLSAHKFGGPKGVGAIVFRDGETRLARAFILGGGQERGQRGGTENIPGIAGMGVAAREAVQALADAEKLIQLRDRFENHLKALAPDVEIVSQRALRLPNTTLFAVPGLAADKALIAFDLDGVAVSSGSACSSGKVKTSHVLEAMGAPGWVKAGAIRVSIGPTTTWDEVSRCLSSLERQLLRRGKAKTSEVAAGSHEDLAATKNNADAA